MAQVKPLRGCKPTRAYRLLKIRYELTRKLETMNEKPYSQLVMALLPYFIAWGPFEFGEGDTTRFVMLSVMVFHLGIYLLVFQAEGIKRALAKKKPFEHFIKNTVSIVLSISFYFTAYYHSLYRIDSSTFSGVEPSGFVYDLVQFFFFSSGITILNGFSPIKPASLYSQSMIYIHSLVTFIAIIILVANYRDAATLSFIKDPESNELKGQNPNVEDIDNEKLKRK